MTTSRRDFLQTAAGAGMAMAGRSAWALPQSRSASRPSTTLDLLILGGTGFLGPHVVEAAAARGHSMTLFNRGRTNTHLFPDLEKLKGDRDPEKDDGLSALDGRRWDAVIDTSGYVPRIVKASAELLAPNVKQYVFISSISVYADNSIPDMDESGPLATMEDETNEEVRQHYGPLKVLCENAAERALPGRTTNIRPGLIVGPLDPTDRFTYWPVRVERGGEVLAPGDPTDPVQYIDARDLAAWIVSAIERSVTGDFNATGPGAPTTIAELLYGCKAVSGSDAQFTWADADFLAEQKVGGWMDMPVWLPPRDGYEGFHRVNCRKAIRSGLRFRPLAETVADTLRWHHAERPDDYDFGARPGRAGLPHAREAEVLAAWHGRVEMGDPGAAGGG